MAVKIQVKRGAKAGLPTLAPGEWGLATDTREVFIGSGSGNIPVATLDGNGKIPVDEIPELTEYLKTSGGTLTGNLTGKNITGTWLQTTAVAGYSAKAAKIAIIDSSGWIYYRTPQQILEDIEAAPMYEYGTEDLVAGQSSLETGKIYLVYE